MGFHAFLNFLFLGCSLTSCFSLHILTVMLEHCTWLLACFGIHFFTSFSLKLCLETENSYCLKKPSSVLSIVITALDARNMKFLLFLCRTWLCGSGDLDCFVADSVIIRIYCYTPILHNSYNECLVMAKDQQGDTQGSVLSCLCVCLTSFWFACVCHVHLYKGHYFLLN